MMTNIWVDPRFGHRYIKAMPQKKAYAYMRGCIYTSNSFFFIEGYATIATEFLIGLVEEDAGAYASTREELPRSLLA